jgi:chemotaxis response regulator CheB
MKNHIDQLNSSNKKLSFALQNLETVIEKKIKDVKKQNQEELSRHHQQANEDKKMLRQKIQELANINIGTRSSGQIIVDDIKKDLEKIKNIINNTN